MRKTCTYLPFTFSIYTHDLPTGMFLFRWLSRPCSLHVILISPLLSWVCLHQEGLWPRSCCVLCLCCSHFFSIILLFLISGVNFPSGAVTCFFSISFPSISFFLILILLCLLFSPYVIITHPFCSTDLALPSTEHSSGLP